MIRNEQGIRYLLERYRAGGSNRYVCPKCGRKKCFTRYVDVDTGEYIADDCGKCDHTASCGYHYPPREYFGDHPWLRARSDGHSVYLNGHALVGLPGRKHDSALRVVRQAVQQQEFFSLDWATRAARRESTFCRWMLGLPFDQGRIRQVLAEYYVGATGRDIVIRDANYGPAVVFWMIDEQMRPHDAKLMAYTSDGHRVGGWGDSMRSICEKSGKGPQLSQTDKVLFGLHLLDSYPQKIVGIVESEKTALVCACRYPQFLWMATGGCGNLQPSKLLPLKDRRVLVVPDSGEYAKWTEAMGRSQVRSYRVVRFMERYNPNTDIADLILGEAQLAEQQDCTP